MDFFTVDAMDFVTDEIIDTVTSEAMDFVTSDDIKSITADPMDFVTVEPKKTPLALASITERAKEYAHAAKADETKRGYASDLRSFLAFCADHGLGSAPAAPQSVALYLAHLAEHGKAVATIRRHAVSIAVAHKLAEFPNPVADPHVRAILQGITRTKGTAQRKKTALTADLLRDALRAIDEGRYTPGGLTLGGITLMDVRDRAILLLTFAIAGRRSEVAALDLTDLRFEQSGLIVTLRRAKTDQSGAGREIGVPLVKDRERCAVRAVKAWLTASRITSGALFRTFAIAGRRRPRTMTGNRIDGRDVARLVQRVTRRAKLTGDFAAHSLRAGFITTAASTKGVSEVDIQRVSGHHSVTILRGYVRRANVFQGAPLAVMFGASDE
jgi:integrase